MPSIVSNQDTEKCLRKIILSEGFTLNSERAHGETGVDILARRGQEEFFIEVIGYKSSPPARAKDFYESFFRAISRLKYGATKCIIAMPIEAKKGLPARAGQYGKAWERIGLSFPELEIWLVDLDKQEYIKTYWNDWLSRR